MTFKKYMLVLLVGMLLAGFFLFDLQQYFTLAFFQSQRDAILAFKAENFWLCSALYFSLYIVVTALSLPAAAIITLAGGAIFGFWWGLVLVSFSSSIGATGAFLLARTLLRDWVQQRFGQYLEPINRGIEKDGMFYLFTLRLVPVFPFFLVNLGMGLTPISTGAFYVVSQLGMLFGTALFVNVGAQLGVVDSLPGIFSIGVIRAILVLALFPWLARALLRWQRNRKMLKAYPKPKRFDTNLIVVGAGSAGLVTAYIAAMAKAKVTLIEKHRMGGDCLNTGCIPSKALLRSAAIGKLLKRTRDFGFQIGEVSTDFSAVMQRVKQVIKTVEPHDSVERYSALGVDCVSGDAKIISPWAVLLDGKQITGRAIVIATGASPAVPEIPGLSQVRYVTSDTVWSLNELPENLLVLGGGPIGCELALAFARLGSKVTIVNRSEHLLPREDVDVSLAVEAGFSADAIQIHNNSVAEQFGADDGACWAQLKSSAGTSRVSFDVVLVATGRKANINGLGLEALGITPNTDGTLAVNEYLQTNVPTIYACGDVAGPYQFTHMASFQAWFASINSLFGSLKRFRVHYKVVPHCTFLDPEVARVGINEKEAKLQGIPYELTCYGIDDLDRAIADGENRGFVKVLTVPGRDKILGATIVGAHAAELLTEFTLAMTHGLGLKKIMGTIHVYPTYSESNKFAAGVWQRNHAPVWLFPWLEKWHRFMRR